MSSRCQNPGSSARRQFGRSVEDHEERKDRLCFAERRHGRGKDYHDRMSRTHLDREEFERWRQEADRALESARLQDRAGLHNWACFAAEQAGRLALKALLHGLGRGPWGHDLVRLGEMARAAGLEVPEDIAATLRRLGRHYIPSRYPDAHAAGSPSAHYGPEDAREAIADAERIVTYVDRIWRSLDG